MADPAGKRATYEDLLAVREPLVAQILDGELITLPRPSFRHAHVSSLLGIDLGGPFQRGRGGPGGWIFLDQPELHFGDDVLVPDLAGRRRERAPDLAATWIAHAPDWVCEVLSPTTQRIDRARERPIYAREGVGHLWFVDPEAQTLEAHRRQETSWLIVSVFGGNERVRAEPFDAIELELAALWGEPE
jgi:Uma2 family endonuclease